MLLSGLYPLPDEGIKIAEEGPWTEEEFNFAQEHLEEFYEEIFYEMAKYGEVEDVAVVDNVSEHMLGNVVIK